MTPIADRILAMLHAIAPDVDPAAVDRARPLPDQLDLDSMDYQSLLARIATEFRIAIAETDVPTLRSIDDLASYVAART
ncbi:MAG TPA: acyl carrier protein [Kofleriaceae bacterium]|nr:acyl carrier protein [Kofleriaceae bacterium]